MRVALMVVIVTGVACGGAAQPAELVQAAREAQEAPAIVNGRLAAGPRPALGCFAWLPAEPAAACITGGGVAGDPAYLAFVDGRTTATVLPATIDAPTANAANETLTRRGFEPLGVAPQAFAVGTAVDVGGTKVAFDSRPYAPDRRYTTFQIAAECGGVRSNVIAFDVEQGDVRASIRILDARAIIEVTVHTVQAGAASDSLAAVVFDAKQCKTLSAIPADG